MTDKNRKKMGIPLGRQPIKLWGFLGHARETTRLSLGKKHAEGTRGLVEEVRREGMKTQQLQKEGTTKKVDWYY